MYFHKQELGYYSSGILQFFGVYLNMSTDLMLQVLLHLPLYPV